MKWHALKLLMTKKFSVIIYNYLPQSQEKSVCRVEHANRYIYLTYM